MTIENKKLEEAESILQWHMTSNKTTDPKPSNMTLEEAETIIEQSKNSQ